MRYLPVEGRFSAAFQSWRDSALRAITAGWPADTIQWMHEPLKSGTQGLIDYASDSIADAPDDPLGDCVDGRVNGRVNGPLNGPPEDRINDPPNGQVNRQFNGHVNEQVNERGRRDDLLELRHHLPATLPVSKELAGLLGEASLYRDAQRWSFLYHILWRWAHGDRTCASAADVDGAKLHQMAKSVRRDKHDMIAYVRFRQPGATDDKQNERGEDTAHAEHNKDKERDEHNEHNEHQRPDYVAEFSPEHDVLAWAADHFAERMGKASWIISTPDAVALSDGNTLSLITKPNQLLRLEMPIGDVRSDIANAPPAMRAVETMSAPTDALNPLTDSSVSSASTPAPVPTDAEALWLIYYRSTFNPARVDRRGLEQRMPVRHWRGLPEAALIPGMLSAAHSGQRELAQARQIGTMSGKSLLVDAEQAQPRRDPASTLDQCRRCELWRSATQVVPGCGPRTARIMLIGEQPGDQEDLAGLPFVGPAGKLLDNAMHEAGLSRDSVYMTNAVKHFKWTPKGKRRIHKTPQQREIEACSGWLEEEWATIRPAVIVALGASALSSLNRSLKRSPAMIGNGVLLATRHPAYALRQSDPEARLAIFNEIVDTLKAAVRQCEDGAPNDPPGQ